MKRLRSQLFVYGVVVMAGLIVAPPSASAQYMGKNFHGDFGVNSGTQAGPGFYVAIPFAQWNADNIKDADGHEIATAFQGLAIRATFPTLIGVTPKKFLGANYGFMVASPFSTIRPERTIPQEFEADWGLNDFYVVPLYLGWHTPRADFVAGYGFYAPTGRYEAGANDNVGLGMWSHEIQAGTTVYLDAAKKISAATTAYFEMHSNKKDQDLKVGNLLTLEGGAVQRLKSTARSASALPEQISNDTGRYSAHRSAGDQS